mmetsp:Transcript_50746/g.157155  ORF Transcript_50746/g.157155 Transcript_50746/m.157155 type:complete len:448 (-) Transcript_50746:3-1346(-)
MGPMDRHEGALYSLLMIAAISTLGSVDHNIMGSAKPLLQKDLRLTDAETALPTSVASIAGVICAVPAGLLSDAGVVDRRWVVALGVAFWSLAMALTALSQNLAQLVVLRALVEAGSIFAGVSSGPLLADIFPPEERLKVYTFMSAVTPLGAALGFSLGGPVGSALGWRSLFILCALPGAALALGTLAMGRPVGDAADGDAPEPAKAAGEPVAPPAPPGKGQPAQYRGLFANPHFAACTGGIIATEVVKAGGAEWLPTLLVRYSSASVATAGLIMGGGVAVGGIGGTLLGSAAAAQFGSYYSCPLLAVPALLVLPSAACFFTVANYTSIEALSYPLLILGLLLLFAPSAPTAAVTMNSLPPRLRGRAVALQLVLVKIFGALPAPYLIGRVSDAATLRAAAQPLWVAPLFAGLCWWAGSRAGPLPAEVPLPGDLGIACRAERGAYGSVA